MTEESRIEAERTPITAAERDELIDRLLNTLEDTLSIQVSSVKHYFVES